VGELTRAVKELLETEHPCVWVEGEVSNLARPNSGHVYLTLKDEEAPLRAVVYRGVALRLKYDLHDGMRVIARGRLSVYTPRGEYQLLVEEVQPKGVGPLELAFRQLKERLSVLGYFEPDRKRPIPRIPRRVALITSPTGSAVRDMLEVFARRWPALEVWVCPARVQGDEAAAEIAAAIGLLNHLKAPIDVLVLARGGGSLEDLWPFNEAVVAHAIFRSHIPVVTGIGHEDDLTIADLVADRRALTPTEAAERLVPDRAEVAEALAATQARLMAGLRRLAEQSRSRLEAAGERLERATRRRTEVARHRLEAAAGKLEGLSPLGVLARGYSLTRRLDDLSVVRSPDQVRAGDRLLTQVAGGQIISRVEGDGP
jgi:exodeoxyribonuclease VII large subunit